MAEINDNKNNQTQNNEDYSGNTDIDIQEKIPTENSAVLTAIKKDKCFAIAVISLFLVVWFCVFLNNQLKLTNRKQELEKATIAFNTRDAKQIINEMMVKCPAGEYNMGSPLDELGRRDDEIQHCVKITKDFYISKYPITQVMYKNIMGINPSHNKNDNCPVENVSWFKAKEFCQKLNNCTSETRPEGYEFDLPTEAQWEYACRAGTTTSLNNGKDITIKNGSCYNLEEVAWYANNSEGKTHPVGQKSPNAWGIYDMHGNIWEWCRDYYGPYQTEDLTDPEGPKSGYFRSDRGGSWINYYPSLLRSANRFCRNPNYEYNFLGFRIVLAAVKKI